MTPKVARARVLLIEDEPGEWPTIISQVVSPVKCTFDIKMNDGSFLGWMAETDIAGRYDVVICNLLYKKAYNYGKVIIRELRGRFPDLPIIVLSGMERFKREDLIEIMNELYATYRVHYVALRHADEEFKLVEFREKFFEAVGYKNSHNILGIHPASIHPEINASEPVSFASPTPPPCSIWEDWKWQSEDGREIIPEGVVRDILVGLGDELPDLMFNQSHRDTICSLAVSREDRRIHFAVELWEKLWVQEPGVPYLTLMRRLATAEFANEMYSEYRDHVVHSIWVYLLGLYLYKQNRLIRETVQGKFSEEEFLCAWKISALFHDIGYTCDRGIDQEEKFLQPLLEELQAFMNFPLREYLRVRNLPLSKKDEIDLARLSCRFTPTVLTLDSIEILPSSGTEKKLLDLIEFLAIPTQLAQDGQEKPLQSYYSFGKTVKPVNRDRFRDHGILSALILLHQFHFLDLCLQNLKGIDLPEGISRKTQRALSEITSAPITQSYTKIVHQAAAAIALHNVNKEIWDFDRAKQEPYFLSLEDYRIFLNKSPLAFLLALVDVLQCWDRPRRRYVPEPEKLSIRNQDVRIVCEGDVIIWSIRPDSVAGKQLFSPGKAIKAMSKYMSCQEDKELALLIREGEIT